MAQRPEEIRREIDHTRGELGDTVDALAAKADVPSRAKGWLGDKKDAVTSKVSGATSAVSDSMPGGPEMGRMRRTAERNPLGLAIGGAAVGFLAGLLAPPTRMEDERLGPMADDVKDAAMETGREALERGKHVAQAAGQTALETAKERTSEESDELSSTLKEKARGVAGSSEAETEVTFGRTNP
jgi:gas vesicle protein